MNEFNDLFDEYFGKGRNINKEMERMAKMMAKLNRSGDFAGMNPEEANLGEPDTKVEFVQDGVTFIKSTWETDEGLIVRIETKEDIQFNPEFFKKNNIPTGKPIKKEVSLEEQLNIAEKAENYELCAKLRDSIRARNEEKVAGENKNNKGIPKKENKDKASENLDNKGLPEGDEWNF